MWYILFLIITGYLIGSYRENAHYNSIKEREKVLGHIPVTNCKRLLTQKKPIAQAFLVTGSVVIAQDYFKRVFAHFKNIFGGRIQSYETLIDRGRREALLRLKKASKDADIIMNLRIETSTVGYSKGKQQSGCIEVVAYGTAIKYK